MRVRLRVADGAQARSPDSPGGICAEIRALMRRLHGAARGGMYACLSTALMVLLLVLYSTTLRAQPSPPTASAGDAASQLRGSVDALHFQPDRRSLEIQGWAFAASDALGPPTFEVRINGRDARVVDQRRVARDDVSASFPGLAPASPGFTLHVQTPGDLGWSHHQVSVTARWDGASLQLTPASPQAQSFSSRVIPPRHQWMAAMLAVFLGVQLLCARTRRFGAMAQRLNAAVASNKRLIAAAIGGVFALLVALGWTGLSLQLLSGTSGSPDAPAFFAPESSVRPVALDPQVIRSDEWLVITPSALAQVHHQPPYPVVNTRLGVDGQNMMVIGMTGVPVLHVSAIAKPATWGFFALPLPNALAWYWFFPFFGCLLALWAFLEKIAPERTCRNLALSLLFCLAPYGTGWSYWPLYTAFFAAAGLWSVISMVQARTARRLWIFAILCGLFSAGFALVLYPPWQIPMALLALLLLVGWWADQRPAHGGLTLAAAGGGGGGPGAGGGF